MTKPGEGQEVADPEVPEGGAETPSAAAPDPSLADALKVLNDIRQHQETAERAVPAAPAPRPETAQREQIKAETGWTDAQIDFHLRSVEHVARSAAAPANEKIAWMELKQEHPDLEKYRKEMDEELKPYPPAQRADPVLLKKVYYLAKGKLMDQAPASGAPGRPAAQAGEVISRRVAAGYPGAVPGMTGDARPEQKVLTDEQRVYARNLGITEADYAKASQNVPVKTLKKAE